MDWAKEYRDLKLDTTRDRQKLARFENGCPMLEHPDLWQKVNARRKQVEAEERGEWQQTEAQNTIGAYWRHLRRWPNGLRASDARKRLRQRLFWHPPKEMPEKGLVQFFVGEASGLLVAVVLAGVAAIAACGVAWLIAWPLGLGADLRVVGLIAMVLLAVFFRRFSSSWAIALFIALASMFPAMLLLWAIKSLT